MNGTRNVGDVYHTKHSRNKATITMQLSHRRVRAWDKATNSIVLYFENPSNTNQQQLQPDWRDNLTDVFYTTILIETKTNETKIAKENSRNFIASQSIIHWSLNAVCIMKTIAVTAGILERKIQLKSSASVRV